MQTASFAMDHRFAGMTSKTQSGRIPPAVLRFSDVTSPYFMLDATKSQLTRFQNDSTYFGRALR